LHISPTKIALFQISRIFSGAPHSFQPSVAAALLSDRTGQDRAEQLPVLTVESRHLDLLDRGA